MNEDTRELLTMIDAEEHRRRFTWLRRVLMASLVVVALVLGMAGTASAGQNGAPVYNYGPVGVGIDITGDGRYDYVLTPGHWTPSNSKGMYVGPGWCVDVFYDGRYVWTGGQGSHSFLWWWNYRIYLAPRRC